MLLNLTTELFARTEMRRNEFKDLNDRGLPLPVAKGKGRRRMNGKSEGKL